MATVGQTLLIDSGPAGKHLFVVVWGPQSVPGMGSKPKVVMVDVCTIDPSLPYDSTCTLTSGEHRFIKNPSYIAYHFARIEDEAVVDANVASGLWPRHDPMDPGVLKRIRGGVCRSGETRSWLRQLIPCP